MIKKSNIKNLGAFKDFERNENLVDDNRKIETLQNINIIFGHNYSGKTTLSRIFRASELKSRLGRYESSSFKLELKDRGTIGEKSIASFTIPVRIFNEDFVKNNLLFIGNPEEGVTPLAVLGESAQIESEIRELKGLLRSAKKENGIGPYLERKNAVKGYQKIEKEVKKEKEWLEKELSFEALDKRFGIKYLSHSFGDQDYTVAKLKDELKKATQGNQLADEQIVELKASLREETKQIPRISEHSLPSFDNINRRIKTITE